MILIGDCRQVLAPNVPERSVHVCVSSPPYWNLRSYLPDDAEAKGDEIGTERTPDEYVAHLVEVMRAARRVLRDDGVCWLNIGDSFAKEDGDGLKAGDLVGIPWRLALALQADGWYLRSDVVWAKRSCMPESIQGTRWQRCRIKVRGNLPGGDGKQAGHGQRHAGFNERYFGDAGAQWAPCTGCDKCKANDGYALKRGSWRPTRSHEAVFMLAKSERYFADGEGVKERARQPVGVAKLTGQRKVREINGRGTGTTLGTNQGASSRNLRDVWRISPAPSQLKHYALMAPALVERCLRAGPTKTCAVCGAPWARVVERTRLLDGSPLVGGWRTNSLSEPESRQGVGHWRVSSESTTLGFRPTCACNAPHVWTEGLHGGVRGTYRGCQICETRWYEGDSPPAPCAVPPTVIDPFLGGGTVAGVAEALGWRWIGCELSADYAALVPRRIEEVRLWYARRQGKRTEKPAPAAQMGLFGDQ